MPRLALIHTVPALAERLAPLLAAALPGWERIDYVDESLLQETIREGRLTAATETRLAAHVREASGSADAVLVTCSTLGEAVDALRESAGVPVFRIDRGMAEEAVRRGSRIGVLATLSTTLGPTGRLIRDTAQAAGRDVTVIDRLCKGAFEQFATGDRASHDAMIRAAFDEIAPQVDVVVLAQASMASALPPDAAPRVPVLTSPELGIAAVAAALTARATS